MDAAKAFRTLLFGVVLALPAGQARAVSSLNDTARVLAGLPPSESSPLSVLAATPAWKSPAEQFSRRWDQLEQMQLSKARDWANGALSVPRGECSVLYYPFSGPDFLYAGSLFPSCRTYVLCGLEPVGSVPDLAAMPADLAAQAMLRLRDSLRSVVSLSFFITKEMRSDLQATKLPGTTPVLLLFLARLGKDIRSAQPIALDREGNELPSGAPDAIEGVRIEFASAPGAAPQTLYYFSTDVSNAGFLKHPGFAKFCQKLSPGAGLVKAASYLLHSGSFTTMRDLLLERCKFLLQDDSGVPVSQIPASWSIQPFGRYLGPIKLFSGNAQKELSRIFASHEARPLPFSYGYQHTPSNSNVVLVSRGAETPPAVVIDAAPAPTPTRKVVPFDPGTASGGTLVQLEQEELAVRGNKALSKEEKMAQLHTLWAKQKAVMGTK